MRRNNTTDDFLFDAASTNGIVRRKDIYTRAELDAITNAIWQAIIDRIDNQP